MGLAVWMITATSTRQCEGMTTLPLRTTVPRQFSPHSRSKNMTTRKLALTRGRWVTAGGQSLLSTLTGKSSAPHHSVPPDGQRSLFIGSKTPLRVFEAPGDKGPEPICFESASPLSTTSAVSTLPVNQSGNNYQRPSGGLELISPCT
jgi:hypothetical protein